MNKILICGHFANDKPSFDGQTIKSVNIYNELIKKYGKDNIIKIDTYYLKKKPIRFFLNLFKKTKNVSNVIMLPAQRGIKVFPIVFNMLKKFRKYKIHYVVIGGWLPSLIDNNKVIKMELMKIDCIYVETSRTINHLMKMGFKNIYQMNNFKKLEISNKKYKFDLKKLKCCIFSRVEKMKGIDDAIEVINKINEKNDNIVSLDIYGKIKDEYKEHFENSIKNNSNITYKGTVDFNGSVKVLENYHLLLFPTLYFTEGIPGTIIDAFFSGLPILSSKWENYDDVIDENINGLSYNFSDISDFENKLSMILHGEIDLTKMSEACKKKAKLYLPDNSLNILYENINLS